MKKRAIVLCAGLATAAALALSQTGGAKRAIQAQVNYTGTGTVDASHKIFVALWDSPDFLKGGGPPVAVKSTASKTGTVTFSDVQTVPAYVSAAYDASGKWDGESGPPPTGASLGMYSNTPGTPAPIDVAPGKTAKVSFSFDDSFKSQ